MIEFAKVRNVKDPKRNLGDAGIDLFIPEYSEELVEYMKAKNPDYEKMGIRFGDVGIFLPPKASIMIPSGLKYKIDQDVALIQFTKSGICLKRRLDCANGVGDSTYQGELHIHIRNDDMDDQILEYGTKITQFVPVKYDASNIKVEEYHDGWFDEETSRGEGGFGSTGVK